MFSNVKITYIVSLHRGDEHIVLGEFEDKNEAMKYKYNYRNTFRFYGERLTIKKVIHK